VSAVVTVDLYELSYSGAERGPLFASTTFDVCAYPEARIVGVEGDNPGRYGYVDFDLDADEARSLAAALLAAALLAAADASEATA